MIEKSRSRVSFGTRMPDSEKLAYVSKALAREQALDWLLHRLPALRGMRRNVSIMPIMARDSEGVLEAKKTPPRHCASEGVESTCRLRLSPEPQRNRARDWCKLRG
jgi:hypothetical protein